MIPSIKAPDTPSSAAIGLEYQATQILSQEEAPHYAHLGSGVWGSLLPCSSSMMRLDLKTRVVNLGRRSDNDIVLNEPIISNVHCQIVWAEEASGTILDLSRNGTFLNGERIGKNTHRVLEDGVEIALGNFKDEHRYIFRFSKVSKPLTGLSVAGYAVTRELGRGGFATVMRALHESSGEWFAIKVIKTTQITPLIEGEISIMKELNHENVCKLKEVITDQTCINLILELVPGGDLSDYIEANGKLAEPTAKGIASQTCKAMAHVHLQGITHQDLKPENILLDTTESYDNPKVKVADFGLAKAVDDHTVLRTRCGTLAYIAPELVFQPPSTGYQDLIDSWSVGLITFYMLTNVQPITDMRAQLKCHKEHPLIDWTTLQHSGVTVFGFDFVYRLLQLYPKDRISLTGAERHIWFLIPESLAPYIQDATAGQESFSLPYLLPTVTN